jgi:3-hydroxymyristoyl/3-hydroxydecanoyl-(acyl carrier protein) dehydratase
MILPPIAAVHRPAEREVTLELDLADHHPAFAGHFPGQPILPGVVQIDWAVRLGAEYLGAGCSIAVDFQVKFRRVIRPGAGVELTLRLAPEKNSLSFEYRHGGEVASVGRVKLGDPE